MPLQEGEGVQSCLGSESTAIASDDTLIVVIIYDHHIDIVMMILGGSMVEY